ncbi:MAG: hypothetical protein LBR52_01795, partial [Prevotellaceae bacterium]|nr:hypothetical protein [Prevotellaceae bacterium]
MKTFKKLAAIILSGTIAVTANAQQVTITAGALDCDNYGNNDIRFSPATFAGDGTQQKITITFAQYQCERCKQITFTKNDATTVNLVQDAASGEFTVTGVQRNPLPVSNPAIAGNKLSFNGLDCGWDVGDISIEVYLKYELSTNTLHYSSNPFGSGGNGGNGNNNTSHSDDLILGSGDKQFIFHTQMQHPNDPPVVFIAPKLPNSTDFDWSKQIILKNDGSLLMSAGNLGVGTTNPQHKLDVNGTIHARELLLDLQAGADFVFEENYSLRPLSEVSDFIQ